MQDVKPQRRVYRSPKRAADAVATRDAVLSAAHRLFLAGGWTGTTIAAIAAAAGVSNETVYASFGSKKALLQALVAQAVRGLDPKTPLIEQPVPKKIAQEANQFRQIDLFAGDIATVLSRVAPLMDVCRVASEADAEIAELYGRLHTGRRSNLEWFAGALVQNGPLRGGMDAEAAASIIWRLASPELFLLVTRVERMSLPAYADWLAESMKILLLEDRAAGGS